MAVKRQVFFDIDAQQLIDSLGETEAFVTAFSNGRVLSKFNQTVYNNMVQKFGDFVDERAKMSAHSDPRGQGDFHHLYETGMVGEEGQRLFRFTIPQEARSAGVAELFGLIEFQEATAPGWSFGLVQSQDFDGSDARVYNDQVPPFRRKAEVFELGEPITLKAYTRFVVRPKENYTNEPGSLPYLKSAVTVDTSSEHFDTYRRLHEEFAAFITSGAGRGVVNSAMGSVERVVVPEVIARLRQRIFEINSIKMHSGTGPMRDLNWRVFNKGTISHLSDEYVKLLESRLEALTTDTVVNQ